MIDTKELRLGNKVFLNFSDESPQVEVTVSRIFDDIIGYAEATTHPQSPAYFFEPIPLTTEILERLGFEKVMGKIDVFHFKHFQVLCGDDSDEEHNVLFYIKTDYGYEYITGALYYLHQLQNLYFALEQKELTLSPSSKSIKQ